MIAPLPSPTASQDPGSARLVPAGATPAGLAPPLGGALPGTLFDAVRDLVLEALAATQWPGFLQSPQFTTYLQYKALETRPATLDDFVFYRVLGRGE
jgi:hypothetical protein